jgi:transposase-like protein
VVTTSRETLPWLGERVAEAAGDLLRELRRTFAEELLSGAARARCQADDGERTPERTNRRTG